MNVGVPLTWPNGLALVALDLLETDGLIDLAAAGLVEGISSELLARLAGMPKDSEQLRALFNQALENLRMELPDRQTAAVQIGQAIASQILTGQLDAFEGARKIATVSRAVGPGFHEFDAFIYAESEGEDRPLDRGFFRDVIQQKARELLEDVNKSNS